MLRPFTSMGSRRGRRWSRRASPLQHCLGARSSEIVFTSGGTEGDNLALFGLVKPGDHIITQRSSITRC